jgi:integrase
MASRSSACAATGSRAGIKASTLSGYRQAVERHLIPWYGEVELGRIDRATVEGHVAAMSASGEWAPKTVANVLVVTKALFTGAVERGHLDRSPAAGVRPPRQDREEVEVPTADAVARSIAAADPELRVAFALAAGCGLRRGELLGLRWADLDLDAGRLRVRRSFGPHRMSDAKTRRSHRTVVIPPNVAEVLRDHRAAQAEHGMGAHVLAGRGDEPMAPEVLDRGWRRAQRRAGVVHHTLHGLRHYAISTWIAAGLSVKAVQEMAGHASATFTLNRYGHLLADDLDVAAVRLAAYTAPCNSE